MKEYIVYSNGVRLGFIRAGSFKSAEKKAKKKYPKFNTNLVTNDYPEEINFQKKQHKHTRNRIKNQWLNQ